MMVILAMTTLPFWGVHWLGSSLSEMKSKPESIFLLGGSGMPSESNLIRIWYTSRAAEAFKNSKIFIVMPGESDDSTGTPARMMEELILRGVAPERIRFETKGTNTRSQALQCRSLVNPDMPVLLITSPENMRRTILTFRKAGFREVNALPSFENASEADFTFKDSELGGREGLLPPVGKNLQLRYQIWTHLKYEILIARELTALAYYRIRGWI